jgi:hypothetical protein
MISKGNNDPLAAKANAAFEEVAHDVIARARAAKTEIVVWRDGTVTKLSPDQAERELAERAAARRD